MGVSESDDEPLCDEANELLSNDDGSIDNTDEEEEDVEAYEDDGFVVDEEDVVEGLEHTTSTESNSEKRRPKDGRKKRRKKIKLDEEDISLIAENQGTNQQRARRRLKRVSHAPLSDRPRSGHTTMLKDMEDLEDFHDDDDDDHSLFHGDGGRHDDLLEGFRRDDDDRDMEDFIVDETGDRLSNKQKRRRDPKMTVAYQEALQEVAAIFGDADKLVEMYETAKRESQASLDPANSGDRRSSSLNQVSSMSLGKGLDEYDPEALAMHCLLPEDDKIRQRDIPERFQERMGIAPQAFEYDLAASWIYDHIFNEHYTTPEARLLVSGQLEVESLSSQDEYCGKAMDFPCKGHRVVRSSRSSEQGEAWRRNYEQQLKLKEAIKKVLMHLYEDLEEIPYIATYRKQICGELLCLAPDEVPEWTTRQDFDTHKDDGANYPPPGAIQPQGVKLKRWQILWTVYELSLKWQRLRLRIEKRSEAFRLAQDEHCNDRAAFFALHQCIDQIQEALTTNDADLAGKRFKLVLAATKRKIPQTGIPTDGTLQRYCTYKEMGCCTIVNGMGLMELLKLDINESDDSKNEALCVRQDLNDVVADIMQRNKGVIGVDGVLAGARHIAVMELMTLPLVRRTATRLYEAYATVTTKPTEQGEKVLDPFHKYGYVKRLVKKPVDSFRDDVFLKIIGATRDGYMTYSMDIDEVDFKDKVLPELMTEVLRADLIELREGWADLRRDVFEHLAKDHLFPSIKKDTVQKLSERARNYVLNQMAEELWKFVVQGPFKPSVGENNYDEQESAVRVCACCWGPGGKGQPSTTLVMLDDQGELKDMIELKQFSGFFEASSNASSESYEQHDIYQDKQRQDDATRIREFLMDHKPHVVVVGCANMICKSLISDFEQIRDSLFSECSRFMVSIQGNMEVILASELIPAVWENSPAAKAELPDHTAHIRRSVALGRCLVDPLSVMASLRDYSNTILSVEFVALQELIIKEEKLAKIDQVMVTATNQLGCELNLMANVQWRAPALQFIAGLGRRKAQGLLHILNRNANRIESRSQLLTYEQLGANVIKNAIGFLIVSESGLPGMANIEFDPLDETRVHINHYSIAKEMAMLAVKTQDPDTASLELSERPHLIRNVDLEYFNKRGIEQGRENMMSIVVDISLELLYPFCDRRSPFAKPDEREVFYLLSNERADTVIGKLVEAVVEFVDENEIQCLLVQSRLKGKITKEQFSGTEDIQRLDLKSRVRRGDVVTARLMAIECQNMLVGLSCRSVDLMHDEIWEKKYCTDEYYYIKTAEEKEQERLSKVAKQEKHLSIRRIDHPLFKNVSEEKCISLLKKESCPGYTILRPSKEGHEYITLSFIAFSGKHGDVFVHRELKEEPKQRDGRSLMRLSLPLTMMLTSSLPMKFDDLDEIIPLFVDPYIDRVKDLKMHRKFRDGDALAVEGILKHEKQSAGQSTAAYCLAVDYAKSGWFYIASILNVNVRQEYFTIVPQGYYFRKRTYKKIDYMIKEFKERPQPRPVQQQPVHVTPAGDEGRQGATFRTPSTSYQPVYQPQPPPAADEDSGDEFAF